VPYAGSLALSDILEKTDTLVTACSRCNRAGRYPMTILIKQHGATYTVPLLLRDLSADCVKRGTVDQHDLCGVHCPDLPALFITKSTIYPSPLTPTALGTEPNSGEIGSTTR
jgi:hypothetical protein